MNILTLLSPGLLSGNELAVGAFVMPSLARLGPREHATGAQTTACMLGRAMPFWMAGTLALRGFSTSRAKNKTFWGAPLRSWRSRSFGLWRGPFPSTTAWRSGNLTTCQTTGATNSRPLATITTSASLCSFFFCPGASRRDFVTVSLIF